MARQPAMTEAEMDSKLSTKNSNEKRDEPKKLVAERRPDGLYFIRYTAGGEVPDELKGFWTSIVKAEAAIANHIVTKAQLKQAA